MPGHRMEGTNNDLRCWPHPGSNQVGTDTNASCAFWVGDSLFYDFSLFI